MRYALVLLLALFLAPASPEAQPVPAVRGGSADLQASASGEPVPDALVAGPVVWETAASGEIVAALSAPESVLSELAAPAATSLPDTLAPSLVIAPEAPDLSAAHGLAVALGAETAAPLAWDAARGVLADTTVRSPLDTLRMSRWERVWWGRKGMMRRVGLFPTHPDEPLDDLRQVARVRRTMLKWHQTAGLVTVASMATTAVAGQIAASGGDSGFHKATLPVTIGLYSTTAALALLSPPKPIRLGERGGGLDSITIHRWLAVGHIAGMLATPLLGEDAGTAHYVLGYSTLATFSAAMLTVTLLRR